MEKCVSSESVDDYVVISTNSQPSSPLATPSFSEDLGDKITPDDDPMELSNEEAQLTWNHFPIPNPDRIRETLVMMVIESKLPISFVDHEGFRTFTAGLSPFVDILPSQETIRRDILKLYEKEELSTRRMVERNESRIAITVDMRESNNPRKWNMALTAHFIDSYWTLQSRVIRCCRVPPPRTKEVIAEELMNIFLEWNLDSKLSTITLDSCSGNGVVDLFVDKISPGCLLLNGNLFQMCSCEHLLDLIAKDELHVIGDAVDRIRASARFWESPENREKFKDCARQLNVPISKALLPDFETEPEWMSTYSMLETALLYKDVFIHAKLTEPLCKISPTEEDWDVAKVMVEKLQILHSVAKTFAVAKYPTANYCFPKICDIKLALTEWISDSNVTIARMASRMSEKFEKYWSVIRGIMEVATVLDPRYKKYMLEFKYSKIYGLNCAAEIERVDNVCPNLLEEYKVKSQDCGGALTEMSSSFPKGSIEFEDVDMREYVEYVRKKRSRRMDVKTEFDYYLEEDVIPVRPHFDILKWWMTKGLKYPTLRQIAKDIYAIPMFTSKPSLHTSLALRFFNGEDMNEVEDDQPGTP